MQNILKIANYLEGKYEDFIFLHSSLKTNYSGQFSIIAVNKIDEISRANFNELKAKIHSYNSKFEDAYFGYISYELKDILFDLKPDEESYISTPTLLLAKFKTVIFYNHTSQKIEVFGEKIEIKEKDFEEFYSPKISNLNSNFTKEKYLNSVKHIISQIEAGEYYQANLTRKFYGEIECKNSFNLFAKLCEVSPSPYSAYMKFGELKIISSSPEQFITVDAEKNAVTRPIKGSSTNALELKNSQKDKAENLMIVDLMRNDFTRVCKPGSVRVDKLFEVNEYATIAHMQSTISGKIDNENKAIDLVFACFPPGSMTGAPKLAAIKVCSELEKIQRGIYSGIIGYFGGDGSADFSVVIRTIILQGNKFEFQVGGGIVYDSKPEMEYQETLNKAKAICQVLGIEIN